MPLKQTARGNEDAFASNDVYNKGAMLLHCLRCNINNDTVFHGLIHDFCTTYKYKTVTSADFINFTNNYTGTNYTDFFNKFLLETSLPVLEYSFTGNGNDLIFRYRWIETPDGFIMPFGVETNTGRAIRMEGTTSWKEIRLKDTGWFNFFNLWKGYKGCPDNSYTYYYTRRVE